MQDKPVGVGGAGAAAPAKGPSNFDVSGTKEILGENQRLLQRQLASLTGWSSETKAQRADLEGRLAQVRTAISSLETPNSTQGLRGVLKALGITLGGGASAAEMQQQIIRNLRG